ncbi:MAG: hypothetical protein KKE16_01280 [Firmicutes bacterium]|nr:hypothetical protein [Bacillota bacterium]
MSNSKLRLVNILAYTTNIDKILVQLMKFPCIDPVSSDKIIESVHGSQHYVTTDYATPLLEEITTIEDGYHTEFKELKITGISDSMDAIAYEIKSVHKMLDEYSSQLMALNELREKYENASKQLQYLSSLSVSLDDIFKCEYVVSRVGKLPLDSVEKLKYYSSAPFIFTSFAVENNISWCMYFTSNGYERAVDNIFSSLLFERVYIPDFVHGTPEEAQKVISLEIDETNRQMELTKLELDGFMKIHQDIVTRMKAELELISKIHRAEKYIVILGSRFSITGFIDARDEEKFSALFKDMEDVSVEVHPADFDKRLKAPRKITRKLCG